MNFSRHLIALVCVLFLTGQVEYQYSYCGAMKRAVAAPMLQCCMNSHPATVAVRGPYTVGRMPLLRIIVKSSTDGFERSRSVTMQPDLPADGASSPGNATMQPPAPSATTDATSFSDALHLSNRCLRI